jgi:cyclic beta-1,2-glucan synthetase
MTVKQGCIALKDAPLLGNKQWYGLLTLLDILSEILQKIEKNNPKAAIESFEVELTRIYGRVFAIQNQPKSWMMTLSWLSGEGWESVSRRLLDLLEFHPNLENESLIELQLYLDLFHHHLLDMDRSLKLFCPWLCRLDSQVLQTDAGMAFLARLPAEHPTLGKATATYEKIQNSLEQLTHQTQGADAREWCEKLAVDLRAAQNASEILMAEFEEIADQVSVAMNRMDFRFLFNDHRKVFHIGYNVSTERLDPSYYDLLASEARIASLIAIAKGDVPQSHWQHLGRPVTLVNGKQVLLSWSGTMFEYLMPTLLVRNYLGTFLSDSCYAALDTQMQYGHEKLVPWGISESGYFTFDVNQNYQYRAFGVPSLGYKRDLPEDLVISPYASIIGLPLQPQSVLQNMIHLEKLNMLGPFGFYEALDFTKNRLPDGQTQAIVHSYMAHHQGMILLAACNYLLDDVMLARFHADEHIQSVELLLQEKIPQNSPFEFPHNDEPLDSPASIQSVKSMPWRVPVKSPFPLVHVLSQGDTTVMVTNAGSGYSQWREFALTRWQPDTTLDSWGTWIYVQDSESGELWSATCQPMGCASEHPDVLFYPHKVDFRRSDHGISLQTGVCVSVDGVEIRRVNIFNEGDKPRRLKFISYGEVVITKQTADRQHPAFNKLFIESEYLPEDNAILFERRLRSKDEKPVVLLHAMVIEAGRNVTREHESDRSQFIGRARTIHNPIALHDVNRRLSGATGGTLDPIFSLAQEIFIKPRAKTRVTFLTMAAPTRAEALEKLSHYQNGQAIYRAFNDASASSETELLKLGLNSSAVEVIQRLLSALLYPVGLLRAAPHLLAQNEKGQPGLWAFGISGDVPILLVRISDNESRLLTEVLQAFTYWRSHHVTVNLVILNEQDTGYALDLQNTILRQIARMGIDDCLNQHDGVFVLRADQIQPVDKILFQTVAGVILDEKNGTLADHVSQLYNLHSYLPDFTPSLSKEKDPEPTPSLSLPGDLRMDNGLGGFSNDGLEYVIHLAPGQTTPHPWINVIANPMFGFLVSEAGSGSTWAVNSGENRLTPWRNDPVSDQPGEAIYLRDEESGIVWSPTLLPAGAETEHIIRHGAGYSTFESQSHGLNQKLRLFAAPDAPVKIVQLRLQNLWKRPRRITVTYYAEWALGSNRDIHQAHILPEFIAEKHALLATNHYNSEFGERVAFLAANKNPHGVTSDRKEFIGRLGTMKEPAALRRIGLASAVNAGLDPCAVIQLHVDLAPGADEEVYFLIGEGANRVESLNLIERMQVDGQVASTWQAVQEHWDKMLNCITVESPDPAMDLMLNRWLLYQTISCRIWGRTALYQSSGAFGFRDQLQDVLALLHTRPDLVREQILEAAQHQFEAGDVLHWWNPPSGRGVRTRFSDDLLWLPYVTAEYVAATGDTSILNIRLPFLKGEPLNPTEMERYAQFEVTSERYSLYEHCRKALVKGTTRGVHGIPLMGSGDWNDGMNRVGKNGLGESIWLGWFLHATLIKFASLTALMKDDPRFYLQQAENLSQAIEAHGWDGEWYFRAFYDDGSLLGSHESTECKIDSIAQSWAVLSGAADPDRASQAIESVNRLLVKPDELMILLFAPPFDKSEQDPGYIKGYLPGVRENGGQYTHAAIWSAWAFAKIGHGERASELFRFLNPINHSDTPDKVTRYKVEPYVVAADIYSQTSHLGQGGWTWYTGSSGWMYRLGLEAILGITLVTTEADQDQDGKSLEITPCIPRDWPGFKVSYHFGTSLYKIEVVQTTTLTRNSNPDKVNQDFRQVLLDGILQSNGRIPLIDDGQQHKVCVTIGIVNSTKLSKGSES